MSKKAPSDEELIKSLDMLDDTLCCVVPPRIFLSSARVAADERRLRENSIGLVICAARSLKSQCSDPENLLLDVTDETTEEECTQFFQRALTVILAGAKKGEQQKLPRMCIALDDDGTQSIRNVALPFAQFLKTFMCSTPDSTSVVVHCVQGKSRCVTLVAAYLMFGGDKIKMLPEALDIIRAVRPCAQPNPTFGAQMFGLWRRVHLEAEQPMKPTKKVVRDEEQDDAS